MARRSPSNPRYQKKAGELGKTRRSAASAKPKRAAGENSASASRSKRAKGKKDRPKLFVPVPTTPEFKRWRKIWMGLLSAAVIFSLVAWWQRDTTPGAVALVLAYGCIFGSLYIDFAKMRPLRKKAIAADKAAKQGERAAEPEDRASESTSDGGRKKTGKKS